MRQRLRKRNFFALLFIGEKMKINKDEKENIKSESDSYIRPDLDNRMNKLEKNLSKFENNVKDRYKNKDDSENKENSSLSGMSAALRLLSEFISAILVSVAIGWAFDKSFDISPWGVIFFLILGFFAGIFNILRTINNISTSFSSLNKLDKGKEKTLDEK